MYREPVSSSHLSSVGYDPASLTLEIEFKDGSVYQYFDVPDFEHSSLVQAISPGTYFHENIKFNYQYIRL